MRSVGYTPSIFNLTSEKKRKFDSSEVRVPTLAKTLTKKALTIKDTRSAVRTLKNAAIFTLSARNLYHILEDQILDNKKKLRTELTKKSAKFECEGA